MASRKRLSVTGEGNEVWTRSIVEELMIVTVEYLGERPKVGESPEA